MGWVGIKMSNHSYILCLWSMSTNGKSIQWLTNLRAKGLERKTVLEAEVGVLCRSRGSPTHLSSVPPLSAGLTLAGCTRGQLFWCPHRRSSSSFRRDSNFPRIHRPQGPPCLWGHKIQTCSAVLNKGNSELEDGAMNPVYKLPCHDPATEFCLWWFETLWTHQCHKSRTRWALISPLLILGCACLYSWLEKATQLGELRARSRPEVYRPG